MNEDKTYVRAVLVYLVNPFTGEVFLARNRKGPCKGMLNGFGGEIEMSERAVEAARRELEEETGIAVPVDSLKFFGNIQFKNVKKDGWTQTVDCYVYVVFTVSNFHIVRLNERELYDCGKYRIDSLPLREMTHGDHLWVRSVLRGSRISHASIKRDFEDGSIISHFVEYYEM